MSAKARVYSGFRCDVCGRRLKRERYVFSKHTNRHFCWPGEGCQKPKERKP